MNELSNVPPDLLRRFVPARFKLVAGETVLETNDLELLETFDAPSLTDAARGFTIRIIRETSPDPSREQRIFVGGSLRLVLFGLNTLFMADLGRRRLYTFLASDFPAARVPHALRLALGSAEARSSAGEHACMRCV